MLLLFNRRQPQLLSWPYWHAPLHSAVLRLAPRVCCAGSCLVLKGYGGDQAMHCVPPVRSRRISITLRRWVHTPLLARLLALHCLLAWPASSTCFFVRACLSDRLCRSLVVPIRLCGPGYMCDLSRPRHPRQPAPRFRLCRMGHEHGEAVRREVQAYEQRYGRLRGFWEEEERGVAAYNGRRRGSNSGGAITIK